MSADEGMEKLGVVTEEPEGKTAGMRTCGFCGSPLSKATNVSSCPHCGTKPFEPTKEEKHGEDEAAG